MEQPRCKRGRRGVASKRRLLGVGGGATSNDGG